MKNTAINFLYASLCLLLLAFASISQAQNSVVVVPLFGDDAKPLANIVTVAKQHGDFTNPVTALASIVDASETNPYTLVIGPGIYELGSQQLIMKEYVEIVGSGQNSTVLRGSVSGSTTSQSTSSLAVGANNASIRGLTIENIDGLSLLSIGLYNDGTSPAVEDITIVISGGSYQFGIYNINSSSPIIMDSTISILNGSINQIGVANVDSSGTFDRSTITVADGGWIQLGINNNGSTFAVADSTITVSGAGGSGIQTGVNNSSSSSIITDSTITVSGGDGSQYGVLNNSSNSFAILRGSHISAPTNSVSASSGSGANETYISDSFLTGLVSGDPKCSFTFVSDGQALGDDCFE